MRFAAAGLGVALAFASSTWSATLRAETLAVELGQGEKLELVRIQKGSFVEGSPANEAGRAADEAQHQVTIGDDFYLGATEVTVGQFKRFVADSGYRTEAERGASGGTGWDGHALVQKKEFTWQHPGYATSDRHPVTIVTYADALAFTAWLSGREGRTFTLPTEAEWEYAARAGTKTAWAGANDAHAALVLGWFKQNAPSGPHPVGAAPANAFGLHDMFGNAAEWCLDVDAPYPNGEVKDPLVNEAPSGATLRRILRGGSWARDVKNSRAAARFANTPASRNADNGFRVRASVHADAAPPSPTSPTSSPSPAHPGSQNGSQNGAHPASARQADGGAIVFALAVFLGGFVVVGAAGYWLLRRRHHDAPAPPFANAMSSGAPNVGFRLAPDGFWVDAPQNLVGQTCRYRVRTDAGVREAEVDLEGTAAGQFVYTGARPLEAVLLGLRRVAVAQRAAVYRPPMQRVPTRGAWIDTSDDGPPSPPRFGGFPSAY